MLYYANRISKNMSRREPEGYLICANVPIARSGTQEYQQDELGQSGNRLVTVYRPEEEVFSKETMSSFEGMPVTNDHPDTPNGVTVDNVMYLGKGHCQNVHRGEGKERDLLIADLVIKDKQTIQDILNGKREISCGYNYELCEEDGKYVQRQIRGNHIAIVDRGRAGHRVCIKDSAPNGERRLRKMAKKKGNHIGILSKMLAALTASDADPEEIEEAVDAIEEITSGEAAPAEPAAPVEEKQTDEEPPEDAVAALTARVEALEAALAAKGTDNEPAAEEDPLKALEDDLDALAKSEEQPEEPVTPDEDPDEMESHFVDPQEINEQDEDETEEEPADETGTLDCKGRDALREAVKAIRPIIAKLPEKDRKKAADALSAQMRKVAGLDVKAARNDYLRLKQATRKKAADSSAESDSSDLAERIMEKRNSNYKK